MKPSSASLKWAKVICFFLGHEDRNHADEDCHYAYCIRCGKIFGHPWQSDKATKATFEKIIAIVRQERDEADAAAKRWYAAASPYATPEALKEALRR